MSVLEVPRKEVRRVMKDGSEYWVEFKDGRIVFSDGRTCSEDEVVHLPPCTPTKIICVHVNYISRYFEFDNSRTPPKSPTYFQKPLTALNAHKVDLLFPERRFVFAVGAGTAELEPAAESPAGFARYKEIQREGEDLHDLL